MVAVFKRSLLATAILASSSSLAVAQQHPTPQQAKEALATRPELAMKVRERIATSGLTPDQIRARLKAAGYPESMLDAYMAGAQQDTSLAAGEDVLRAVRYLGLVDSLEVSMPRDTMGVRHDSVTMVRKSSQIFGLDIFRRSTSQFEADLAGPVDANYKIGPRDVLALILTGGVENSYTLEVTREGFVVIPQVGQIYVANLTLEQASDIVFRRLQSVYSSIGRGPGAATKFYLTVAKLRTNQVFVVGDVAVPGSYQVSSAGTMLTALYAAGGPSESGSLRGIELRRGGRTVGTLDVYDYLTKGDASKDLRLETGDVIFVPVHGARVELKGEIVRPAIYELSARETMRDVLRTAGGFTPQAGRQRVLVRRILPPSQRSAGGRDRTVLDVQSDDFEMYEGPSIPLEDGDIVEIFRVPERVRNQVSVVGAVWTPGAQGFAPGMTLSQAIKRAGGVKPDVRSVLITRLQPDESRAQLRTDVVDTLGTLVNDLMLQEDDSITVFGASDFRPNRYVIVSGAVNKPGRYPWRAGMTLRDLVATSGGMADGAYLVQAEVARLPENRETGALARTVMVPLDSSYLLERGHDGTYNGPPGAQVKGNAAPFTLLPYDNVLILRQPDWTLDRSVVITGQVRFPGRYTLASKSERVSDLIARAGGLLPEAHVPGAVFTRENNALGRIGVDLDRALKKPSSADNFTMLDGDSLHIPRYKPTVKVEGAVNSAIAVAYVPGKDIDYYIRAAGGARWDADPRRRYVRMANGIVDTYRKRALLIPDHLPHPDAGSVVVVPAKDPNDKKDYTAVAGSVAQILASMVAVIALIARK